MRSVIAPCAKLRTASSQTVEKKLRIWAALHLAFLSINRCKGISRRYSEDGACGAASSAAAWSRSLRVMNPPVVGVNFNDRFDVAIEHSEFIHRVDAPVQ